MACKKREEIFMYRKNVAAAAVLQEKYPDGIIGKLAIVGLPNPILWRIYGENDTTVIVRRFDLDTEEKEVSKHDFVLRWHIV